MIIILDCTEKSYLMSFLKNLVIGMNFSFVKKNANDKFKTAKKTQSALLDLNLPLKKFFLLMLNITTLKQRA